MRTVTLISGKRFKISIGNSYGTGLALM